MPGLKGSIPFVATYLTIFNRFGTVTQMSEQKPDFSEMCKRAAAIQQQALNYGVTNANIIAALVLADSLETSLYVHFHNLAQRLSK